jgi:hypothetical protein
VIRLRLPGPDSAAAIGLAVLTLALFPGAVFRGEVFYERDLHLDWYPRTDHWVRALAAGSPPLWDNWIGFGQPLLADPSAQILYPPNWLNLFVLPWRYYTIFVVLHVALAGLGVYRLGRAFDVSKTGSLTAAAAWMLSGPVLSLVNVHHLAGAALMPWVILAARAAFARPSLSRAVAFGLVECLQVLAGSPDLGVLTNLVVGALALTHVEWRRPWGSANRRLAGHAAIAAAIALGLSAALWVPALELARRSSRWALAEDIRTGWSVPVPGVLRALFPLLVNDLPASDAYRLALFDSGQPFLASIYLGTAALALAAASFLGPSRGARSLFGALGLAGLLVSLGRHAPFYDAALVVLPPLRLLRYPSKAMVLVALATALLAGLGLDACRGPTRPARRRVSAVTTVAALLAVLPGAAALAVTIAPDAWGPLALGHDPESPLASLLALPVRDWTVASLAAGAVLVLVGRRGAVPPAAAAAVAALCAGDLLLAHHRLNATAPSGLLTIAPPAAAAVRSPERARVYVFDYHSMRGKSERYLGRGTPYQTGAAPPGWLPRRLQTMAQRFYLLPPSGSWWGLEGSYDQDVRGLYPRSLANMVLLLRASEGTPLYLRLLRLGAVGSVVALHSEGFDGLVPAHTLTSFFPEPIRVYRVPDALPRTYAVGRGRVAAGPAAFTALASGDFDPAREVLLPEGPELDSGPAFAGASRILEFRPDRVRIEAELTAAGYVVLVDTWDPGWRATVDGTEAPVLRANIAFRAVRVPPGRHRVELRYRPRAVALGFAATTATALILLVLGVSRARRRGPPAEMEPREMGPR